MAGGAGNEACMQRAPGEDGSEFFTSRCGEGAGKTRAEPSAEATVVGTERRLLALTESWDRTGAQEIHPSSGVGRAGSSQACPALSLGSPFPGAPPSAAGLKHSRGSPRQRRPRGCGARGGAALHRKDSWWHSSGTGREQLPSQPESPAVAGLGISFMRQEAHLGMENGRLVSISFPVIFCQRGEGKSSHCCVAEGRRARQSWGELGQKAGQASPGQAEPR